MSRPQNSLWTLPWPNKYPSRTQKSKNVPNSSQNQKSELKETKNIRVVQQQEQTPNQFLNLSLASKNNPFVPQKSPNDPDLGKKN